MLTTHPRWIIRPLVGIDVKGFDLDTAVIVGSPSGLLGANGLWIRREVATNWAEVLQLGRPITRAATAPGAVGGVGADFLELLGKPVKNIYGYGGTSEMLAALDRGEVDAANLAIPTPMELFPGWFEKPYFVSPLLYWTTPIEQSILDLTESPQPPHVFDVADATPEQEAAFNIVSNFNAFHRTVLLPNGTSDAFRDVWRASFKATLEDPEFLNAASVANLDFLGYVDPQEIDGLVAQQRALSDEAKAFLAELAGSEGG